MLYLLRRRLLYSLQPGFETIGNDFSHFMHLGTSLIFSRTFTQLGIQALSALAVMLYSFVLAFVIGFVIEKTIGFRVKNEDEVAGIDLALHGEEGYVLENSRA